MRKCFFKVQLFLATLLILSLNVEATVPTITRKVDSKKMNQWVENTFKSLSPRERIAQLMMPMVAPNKDANLAATMSTLANVNKVGGVLLSEGNTAAFAKVVNYLQSNSAVPMMISIDGEWGPAMRVTDIASFPRNMALGAITDDRLIYEYGREVARQCKLLGIHVNFAPVLDVNTDPANPVIGTRSFGENPAQVGRKGIAYAKGLEDGGVLSVAKHFPGHGSTNQDSHKTLPTINRSLGEVEVLDIYPFAKYIGAGLGGVLVGHLDVPCFKIPGRPATFNENIVKKYLGNKLKFEGLIFTDALGMAGASGEGSPCVKALKAGNDVLLSPKNIEKELDAVEKAISEGELKQSQINEKCKKILRYKYILKAFAPTHIESTGLEGRIDTPNTIALINKLCATSITVFKNANSILPLKDINNVVIFNPSNNNKSFIKTCELYNNFQVTNNISSVEKSDATTVVVPISKDDSTLVKSVNSLVATGKNVVIAFMLNPYKVSNFATALAGSKVSALIGYDDSEKAQNYAAQAIFGGIKVNGKLPVSILNVAKAGAGVSYPAVRLGYGTASEVGVNPKIEAVIDSLINIGVKTGAFPGCEVLMVKDNKVFINKAYGYQDPDRSNAVTTNTLYDLASVTKTLGTLPGVMKIYDQGKLDVNSKASNYIPGLRNTDKRNITVKELLFHESGIMPSLNLYDIMLDPKSYKGSLFSNKKTDIYSVPLGGGTYGNSKAKLRTDILSKTPSKKFNWTICNGIYGNKETYDTVMHRIYTSKLFADKSYRYSCLNFCLLMDLEQRVTNIPHEQFVNDNIFKPLGASRFTYLPLRRFSANEVAPTEYDALLRGQKMHGYVHDELACFSGGIQGNAGLFCNANDIAKYCQMLLNNGVYGRSRIFSTNTVTMFTTVKSPNSRRGLGFDKPDVTNYDNSPTCKSATAATYGHTGFTGTCFWVDPTNNMIFIFLCNRVNPTRNNKAFSKLNIRDQLFQAFYDNMKK